jgi:Protein of unknown function (DUF3800)
MHFCYIDESGDSQALTSATCDVQPALVIGAMFIPATEVKQITSSFIALKRQFYPNKLAAIKHDLDVLMTEIKGSEIRTAIRKNGPRAPIVVHNLLFLDAVLALLKTHKVKIVARAWIKKFNDPLSDNSVYTISTQNICTRFQEYLVKEDSHGVVIADFRDPNRNSYVAHSVFTQKHKSKGNGDAYPRVLETSTFGISHNHACLQIMDLLCSAIISPMITRHCVGAVVQNSHTHRNYDLIRARYKKRIKALQFHCKKIRKMKNKSKFVDYWGITIKNPHNKLTALDVLN